MRILLQEGLSGYNSGMKRFSTLILLCAFLSGCQSSWMAPDSSSLQNGSTLQNSSEQNSPENQLDKTGMMQSIYSQQADSTPQYLMGGGSQQQIVTDAYKQQLLSGPVSKCFAENGVPADTCYEDFFKSRTLADGPEAAFTDLKILYNTSPAVSSYCHPLAHVIGRAAVEKYTTVDQAYEHGDSFCWSGYYHGVMEAIMTKIGKDNLGAKLDTICADIPGKSSYSFMYYNCVHGMGHGLMDVEDDNIFNALKMCENLTGDWEKQSCYSGVFMQNIINDGTPFHSASLKPSDTVYPCDAVDQKYKQQCYLMQTSYMLQQNGYNFAKTFAICAKVDKGFNVTCYRSEGRDASGSTISDIQKTRTNCLFGTDYTQQSECFVGAVKDFISYYHDDSKAKQLCQSLDDPTQTTQAIDGPIMTQYCLQTAADYYKTF